MSWRLFHVARFVRRLLFGPGKPPEPVDLLNKFHAEYARRFPSPDAPRPLPFDLRCLLWEARKDVDDHVIGLRRARYHRGERDLSIVPPPRADDMRALVDGNAFLVNGRATSMFVDLKPKPPEPVTCALCKGAGTMRQARIGDAGANAWSVVRCPDCQGTGLVDKNAGTGEHVGADVLAFTPGQGDGIWWAEFRVRGLPGARYGQALTGKRIDDVIKRALELEGVEIA